MNYRTKLYRGQQVSSWAFRYGVVLQTFWKESTHQIRYLVQYHDPTTGPLQGWFDGDELTAI